MGFETSMDLILGYKIKNKDLGNFIYSMFNQQDNTGITPPVFDISVEYNDSFNDIIIGKELFYSEEVNRFGFKNGLWFIELDQLNEYQEQLKKDKDVFIQFIKNLSSKDLDSLITFYEHDFYIDETVKQKILSSIQNIEDFIDDKICVYMTSWTS